jgi:thiol:disulfide interchange protein DsbC
MLKQAIAPVLMLLSTVATAKDFTAADVQKAEAKITGMVELPIYGINAVESDGQIVFLSENGRFVISGQIYDLWQKKPLSTLSEMRDIADRFRLRDMNVDIDAMNVAKLGTGPKEVVVFVDPQCSACHQLMEDAKALKDEYTFKFVVIPVLGDKSNRLARALSCITDQDKAFEALSQRKLGSYPTSCSSKRHDLTLLTAQLLNIRGVPYLIAPDGRVNAGRPQNMDLKAWLESDK